MGLEIRLLVPAVGMAVVGNRSRPFGGAGFAGTAFAKTRTSFNHRMPEFCDRDANAKRRVASRRGFGRAHPPRDAIRYRSGLK